MYIYICLGCYVDGSSSEVLLLLKLIDGSASDVLLINSPASYVLFYILLGYLLRLYSTLPDVLVLPSRILYIAVGRI